MFGRKARPSFTLPLDPTATRALEEWSAVDSFIPFAEWAQASTALLSIMDYVEKRDIGDDPGISDGAVYGGHILAVIAAHHGSNWDILREYDLRVREEIARVRRVDSKMQFDITKIHLPSLDLAAGAIRRDGASFVDMASVNCSKWSQLLALPHSERGRFYASWTAPPPAPAPPIQQGTSSSGSPKRKTARQSFPTTLGSAGGSSAFQGSSSSSSSFLAGGVSKSSSNSINWCPICCSHTNHRWRGCLSPAAGPSLYRNGPGWQFMGQNKLVCINFNCGLTCASGRPQGANAGSGFSGPCMYGHYCTRCGGDHSSLSGTCMQFATTAGSSSYATAYQQPAPPYSQPPNNQPPGFNFMPATFPNNVSGGNTGGGSYPSLPM